jgi:hypothetical protein
MTKDLSLDEEGIPDLAGPLPEKVRTGDEQEGLMSPSDRPAALDWGTTAEEQRAGEPLSMKIARERPETGRPVGSDEHVQFVDDEARANDGELVADATETDLGLSAEEAAMHVVELDTTPES